MPFAGEEDYHADGKPRVPIVEEVLNHWPDFNLEDENIAKLVERILPKLKHPRTAKSLKWFAAASQQDIYFAFRHLAKEGKAYVSGSITPRKVPKVPERTELWQQTPEYAHSQTILGKIGTWFANKCASAYEN